VTAAVLPQLFDELASVADAPRYLVGRPLPDPSASAPALLGRVLLRRSPFPIRHHPVPADLGRRKERAADDGGYETVVRDIWV
jgi:hypothetical protein